MFTKAIETGLRVPGLVSIALIVVLAGCAAPPTQVGGVVTAKADTVKLKLTDKRAAPDALKAEVDTKWGVGKRVDEKAFVQPPITGFAEAVRNAIDKDKVPGGQLDLEVSELDIVMTPGHGNRADVMGSPAAQSQMSAGGGYGIAGGILAQAFAQVIENAKAPNYLTLRVKGRLGTAPIECEQDGAYSSEDEVTQTWIDLTIGAAYTCTEHLRKN